MTLYLIEGRHAKGEARVSLYIVCLNSYAGFTAINCQRHDGHNRHWLGLLGQSVFSHPVGVPRERIRSDLEFDIAPALSRVCNISIHWYWIGAINDAGGAKLKTSKRKIYFLPLPFFQSTYSE